MSQDSLGIKQSPAGSGAKDPLVLKLESNKLRLGCTRDDYRTLQIIGKGSFGHVFLAYSIHGNQPHVAIKKIDKELLLNEYNVERLNSEITIHLNMNHENIVELFLYFEQHNSYYLVMEYCKGGDLYKFLKKQKTFNEAQSKLYMTQIVNALLYLQSFGVVHRDLKLSNILLTEDLKQLKISDFGLSTKLDSIDGEQSTILGTPNYMAYEIVNKMNYGMKVDNWSLGCILYTFLVGESPFDEGSRSQTFDKIKNLDYKIPEFISKNARDLIEKLLHPDPTKRISLTECKSHPFLRESIPKLIQTTGITPNSKAKTQEEISSTINKTPFNTVRIKSFTHKKNDIHIEINDTGNVFLTFNNGERRFIVSGDGKTIWYEKKASRRKEFSFYEMPASVEKYYEYARNLIDTIKSKTPKIVYLDTDFKCIQMENHPFPDYETSLFPSGIRMVYQRRKSMVIVRFSKERSVSIHLNKDLTLFKEEMDLTDNHKIVKVEGSLTVEESEILFNNSVLWSSLVHVKKGIDLIEQAEREMTIDSYPFFINATSNTSGPLSPTLSDTSTTSSNNSSTLNRCLLSSLSFSTNNSESNPPDDSTVTSYSNQHFY